MKQKFSYVGHQAVHYCEPWERGKKLTEQLKQNPEDSLCWCDSDQSSHRPREPEFAKQDTKEEGTSEREKECTLERNDIKLWAGMVLHIRWNYLKPGQRNTGKKQAEQTPKITKTKEKLMFSPTRENISHKYTYDWAES